MRQVRAWLVFAFVCCLAVSVFAACTTSVATPAGEPRKTVSPDPTGIPTSTPMVHTATPLPTEPLPTPTAVDNMPIPATVAPSPTTAVIAEMEFTATPSPPGVWVTTDRSQYVQGDAILVTIDNSLGIPIYALTGGTYCRIVVAQRKEESIWQDQGACIAGAPPTWVEIPTGTRERVDVAPRFFDDRPLTAGRYRIRFVYRMERDAAPDVAVYSSEFDITPQ